MAEVDPVNVKLNLDLSGARAQFDAFKQQMAQGVTAPVGGSSAGPVTFGSVSTGLGGQALLGPMNLGGGGLSPMMSGLNQLTAVMAALPGQIANAIAVGLGGGGGGGGAAMAAGIGGAFASGGFGGGGTGMNRLGLSLIAAAGGGRAGSLAWRFSRAFGANPAFLGALVGAGALDALATETAGLREYRTGQLISDNPFELMQRTIRRDLGGEGRWFGARAGGGITNFLGDLFPGVDSADKVTAAVKVVEANYARNRQSMAADLASAGGTRVRDAYTMGNDALMERQKLQEESAQKLQSIQFERDMLENAINAKFKGPIPDSEWATYKSMTGRLASLDRTITNTTAQGKFDLDRLIYTQGRESESAISRLKYSASGINQGIAGNELGSAVASIQGQFLPLIDDHGKIIGFKTLDPKTDRYQEKLKAMTEVYNAEMTRAGVEDEQRSITRRGAIGSINAAIARDPLGSQLTQIRAERDAAMVGVTDPIRRQQIENLYQAQTAQAVQQRRDQETMLNLGGSTQERVLRRQLAMDTVGASAAGIGGGALAEATQLMQGGFGAQSAQAIKNGRLQLDLLRQQYGLSFRATPINLRLMDVSNPRDSQDPMEAFRRIREEKDRLAVGIDPHANAPFGGSSNAAAIGYGDNAKDAAKDSTLKELKDLVASIITAFTGAIKN